MAADFLGQFRIFAGILARTSKPSPLPAALLRFRLLFSDECHPEDAAERSAFPPCLPPAGLPTSCGAARQAGRDLEHQKTAAQPGCTFLFRLLFSDECHPERVADLCRLISSASTPTT